MITFMEAKEKMKEVVERCLDPQLWHACAGGMVQMPPLNSKVFYFPQGHAEHACGPVDFARSASSPPYILCRVSSVKFMADPDTDEVFAKLCLSPLSGGAPSDDDAPAEGGQEKPASFAKTLTQSDANNGGGFSVPRYCAETIFPRLDYSADPPVQTILAKDVHGDTWKFRHIYRGTPRRHLLTTGWSTFVNHKKLIAGDSIVFLRAENGDLCVGIRRAKRGGGGPESASGWNCGVPYGGFSAFLNGKSGGKVRGEAVVEAARLAWSGQAFEVVYYPRASTPEFCVKAPLVRAALQIRWCSGMRFKMAFETEDSSRISWFMGTISSVQVADSLRWPDSPWRLLQVSWDEPDLLQNVKRVSPWLVELVPNMPGIHMSSFSPPPIKKLRMQHHHHPDFPALFTGNNHLLGPTTTTTSQFGFPTENTPAGMQGARHITTRYALSLSDLHLNKLRLPPFPLGFPPSLDHLIAGPTKPLIIQNPITTAAENVSCLLTMSHPPSQSSWTKPDDSKPQPPPQLVLFGKPILTEQQISLSSSCNSSSDGNVDNNNNNHPHDEEPQENRQDMEPSLETGHCKVFMESEDVGRTLDLSLLESYDDLYRKLAEMFGIENSETLSHALYRNGNGAMKHIGDEPFRDFSKTARRLTILMDSSSDNNLGM